MPDPAEGRSLPDHSKPRTYYCTGVVEQGGFGFPVRVVLGSTADRLWAELEAARERYESLAVGRDAESDANERLRAEIEALRKRTCLCAFRGKDHGPIFPSVADMQAEVERLRGALTKIERLKAKWDAPLTHPVGDMSDPAYAGAAAWAAVGSEAHKIAETALQTDEVTR